ncbi:MAG: OadG family protein [Clostridia bacterium]|nr:OadG family protein [Clostridia bacterium]
MRFILPLTESVETAVNDISAVPEDVLGKLIYGLRIALIGLGMVFAVLLILMAVLYLFKFAFAKNSSKKQPSPVDVKAPPVTAPARSADTEDELIPVVIAAAVAAYMENTAPHSKYRIRSFKRI